MNIFKNTLYTLIAILTAITVQILFDKELVLDAKANFDIRAQSDSFELGGKSKADLKIINDKIILNCEIIKSAYAWPFCNITFKFYDDSELKISDGINFSNFEFIQIKAKYINKKGLGIRLQLRSFDESYASKNDTETWKFIGLEYWPKPNSSVSKIPLNALQVPSWWIIHNKVDLINSGPDYNNVMVLEFATASGIPPGLYEVEVEEIKLVGKYITKEATYGTIVVVVILGLLYIIIKAIIEKSRLNKKLGNIVSTNKLLHQKNKNLSKLVNIDELTQTLNRRACQEIFDLDFSKLCVIFMDLDHFKQVNDNYGHDVGDLVLQKFAELINHNIRDRDFFIRWGGEEFLLVSPDFNIEEAVDVSHKIKQLISECEWPHNINITCSFGVSERQKGEHEESVIGRADKALYKAKQSGRNKVVVAEDHFF
jgi:diguanylate cyclase (GGDEF)-like protein